MLVKVFQYSQVSNLRKLKMEGTAEHVQRPHTLLERSVCHISLNLFMIQAERALHTYTHVQAVLERNRGILHIDC